MSDRVIRHTVENHWPRRGIRWPDRQNAQGKTYINPLSGRARSLRGINRALKKHPDAPKRLHRTTIKTWIDSCFAELVLAAASHAHTLTHKSLYDMFAAVKPEVSWVENLTVNCITNLFLAFLIGRGAWKLHAKRPDEEVCRVAEAVDVFQEQVRLIGGLIDVEISTVAPDGSRVILQEAGVEGFLERGLLYPEYHLVAAELSEGLHRLTISLDLEEDVNGMADALGGISVGKVPDSLGSISVGHFPDHVDVNMD
ncbi:hypothetical protein IMZ48_06290 [Candidatus Bathyarchaeota archaeon]|nr:hypothetical protein [Candidatus Bathyarchaeota archaeon]